MPIGFISMRKSEGKTFGVQTNVRAMLVSLDAVLVEQYSSKCKLG